jgi:predicted nucleic acid-binding protein
VSERIYWDSCVPLSYVNGTPDRTPVIDELLRHARRGEVELITSVLSITEVAFAASEQADGDLSEEVEDRIDSLWTPDSPIELVEFHDLIARDARGLIRRGVQQKWGKLKPPDAIHLATANRVGVDRFHTYDDRLLRWDGVLGFPVTRPEVAQGTFELEAGDGEA